MVQFRWQALFRPAPFHRVGQQIQQQRQRQQPVLRETLSRVSSALNPCGLLSTPARDALRVENPKPLTQRPKPAVLNYSIKSSAGASSNKVGRDVKIRGGHETPCSDGPQLSPEQANVVALAASGRNIFYTGSAGCGKSTVLRAIVKRLKQMDKCVVVLAPTGRAALAVGGMTTWSFAGWTPNSHKRGIEELKAKARSKKNMAVRRRLRETDVVIIDEISMVENLHFERLDQVMRAARHRRRYQAEHLPFGGVQVIATGDFAQLPPVKPFRHCIDCGNDMDLGEDDEEDAEVYSCGQCKRTYNASNQWAFRSKAWEECGFEHVYLDTIHRQHDPAFISLLNKCRLGEPFTPEEVDLLMHHETDTTGAVELYPTREEVRLVNEREYNKLDTKAYSFRCRDTFVWNKRKHPHLWSKGEKHADGSLKALDEHSMNRLVELKCGMPVVLLVNLSMNKRLCNGSQGIIVGWTALDVKGEEMIYTGSGSDGHAALKEREIKAYKNNMDHSKWPIVRFSNGVMCTIGPQCQVDELGYDKPYSLMCRTQLPLTPAWALSIHKAQGMTLDRVRVDVSKAFADGQVYVALSRATSLQGLEILGGARGLELQMRANDEVVSFYKHKFGR
ncbi:hypothetical protein KVR01_002335 [Diaporthe batatas]|uniref:uncharacterized protein n=1 Tax=Diaporthe batatas TaxID=748121 RepID=UPI001D046F3D|nr:uncharacterized protein KVR01_002335 [Diaporthe batatas]KAG8166646.1 hypothetical protein KVR01_002335 [Diaporthe batatas]